MPFRLSTRGHYAVLLMYELARSGESFISLSQISSSQKISQGYLEQIIKPLRESGLVKGRKGSGGGYMLAKDPSEITVGEIVRSVEGPVIPVKCVDESAPLHYCPDNCRARMVWQRVGEAIDRVLDSITLSDLLSEERLNEKERRNDS